MFKGKGSPAQPRLLTPQTIDSFMCLMADILRLPEETLALAFLYYNKYKRFNNTPSGAPPLLDAHTLALTSLTLATKTTSNPRRLRSILLAAHHLLEPHRVRRAWSLKGFRSVSPPPPDEPLTIPSRQYDTLRATVVRAELIHLRVLNFELRLPLPFEYLPRYLDRAIGISKTTAGPEGMFEDYDSWDRERKEEDGVVGLMETGWGRAARAKVVDACKNYKVANFYPARAVAAASVWATLPGGAHPAHFADWLEYVTGGKVDRRDCDEIMDEFERQESAQYSTGVDYPRLDDVTAPILRSPGQEFASPSEMGHVRPILGSNTQDATTW